MTAPALTGWPENMARQIMGHRYFVDHPITSDEVIVSGAEAHHLQHVMRASIGDEVVLFDGSGREFRARIDRLGRSQAELSVLESNVVDRESPRRVVIGVTLPKADRQRWLIEKTVELGVARVVPLRSARSAVHPDQHGRGKLQRAVIEASKQCGRNQLMEVAPLTELLEFLRQAPADALRWIADPSGAPIPDIPPDAQTACLLVGPEGGFAEAELLAADAAGWQRISLGVRILRIETACLALAALVTPRH